MLDYRLDRHDRTQLELKLGYGIRPGRARQRYRVETYVFVPTVLAINSRTYRPSRFYEDTATFIRMTTPKVGLHAMANAQALARWAAPIHTHLRSEADQAEPGPVVRSIKVIACIFKGALRDERLALRAQLDTRRLKQAEVVRLVQAFASDIGNALNTLRELGAACQTESSPRQIKEAWTAVDEYVSLLAEQAATDIVVHFEERLANNLGAPLDALRDLAIAEYQHRRKAGYQSYALEGERNEYLPHRWRVLKRYVSSALYLDVSREDPSTGLADMVAMTAAAIAMLFATVVALWSTERFGANLSAAFVGAMVLSYVIKDRIKELGKRHLGQRVRGLLPDQVLSIRAADTEEPLGRCRETFHIESVRKVDQAVRDLRYADLASHDAIEGRPETVLCYTKDVELSSEALGAHLAGSSGLTDVVRLNIQPLLARMDDVWEVYRYVHPITRTLQLARCARVYHVNVVLRITAADGETALERVRVVVGKKGILRVEPVSPNTVETVRPTQDGPISSELPVDPTAEVMIDDE